jgi:hypothetical protein
MTSVTPFQDKVGTAQQTQMLGDRRPGDGKGLRDLAGRLASLTQQVEHGAAGGIG